MNNSEARGEAIFLIIIIIIVCTAIASSITRAIGIDVIYNDFRRDACQAISVTTKEYINCNTLQWEDVVKKISKAKDGE